MIDSYKRIVVFDLETTGLNPKTDKIIEFGAQIYSGEWQLIQEISTFLSIDFPLPEKIKQLTNISDEDLVDGLDEAILVDFLNRELKPQTLLVAYNIQFDISFLDALFERHNKHLPPFDLLDVMVIYKDRHPSPHNLKKALLTYHSPYQNAHRALEDVKGTADILLKMHDEQDVSNYINYVTYHKNYGIFGKVYPHITYKPYQYK